MGVANDDSLSRGESVGLDDHGQALRPDVRGIEGGGGECGVARRGYAMAPQEFLGECLGAFETRRGTRWAEAGAPGGGKAIDDPGDQRAFGPDDGERNVLAHRECQQGFDVLGGDVDIPDLGLECGSGVAGRHPHFAHARGLRAFPGEGVFAAACTDDQNLHAGGLIPSGGSGACR